MLWDGIPNETAKVGSSDSCMLVDTLHPKASARWRPAENRSWSFNVADCWRGWMPASGCRRLPLRYLTSRPTDLACPFPFPRSTNECRCPATACAAWQPALAPTRRNTNTNTSPAFSRKRNKHGPPYLDLPSVKHGTMRHGTNRGMSPATLFLSARHCHYDSNTCHSPSIEYSGRGFRGPSDWDHGDTLSYVPR